MNSLAAWLVLTAYLAFAYRPWRVILARMNTRFGAWSVAIFLLPFLLATELSADLSSLMRMTLYIALPTIWQSLSYRYPGWKGFFLSLTILNLWLPIEPDLFFIALDQLTPGIQVDVSTLSAIFEVPDVKANLVNGVDLPISNLTGILLVLYLFLIHRPLKNIGFTFRLSLNDLKQALLGLLAFILIGLPLGLAFGFLRYLPDIPSFGDSVVMLLAGYLLIALIEEVLFRGLIQNLLTESLGSFNKALPIASIIFGLAHINNSTPRFDVPNWGYALMAALAGATYGWVWWRTKKVTASAITHALVNFVWGILFTG